MARPGALTSPMARPGAFNFSSPMARPGAWKDSFNPLAASHMWATGYSGTPSWNNRQVLADETRKNLYDAARNKQFAIPHGGYSGTPAPVNVTTNSPTYNININGADISNKDAHDHLVKKVLGALKQADAKNNTLRRI